MDLIDCLPGEQSTMEAQDDEETEMFMGNDNRDLSYPIFLSSTSELMT